MKQGDFEMPRYFPARAQRLIHSMLERDPERRISVRATRHAMCLSVLLVCRASHRQILPLFSHKDNRHVSDIGDYGAGIPK